MLNRIAAFVNCLNIVKRVLELDNWPAYLDLGCGHGKFMHAAWVESCTIHGIDGRRDRLPPEYNCPEFFTSGRIPEILGGRFANGDFLDDFDVVGILGLLYHLDGPMQVRLAGRMKGFPLIIDTHFAPKKGVRGYDRLVLKGDLKEVENGYLVSEGSGLKSSIGNSDSLWPTEAYLSEIFGDHLLLKCIPETSSNRAFFIGLPK